MGLITKICPNCETEFLGRSNKAFCKDQCRFTFHAKAKKVDKPKLDASAMGSRNRSKGARAENEVCHILADLTGEELHRNLGQARDSGGDVDWGPFLLEVKYQQTYSLPHWQRQVTEAAAERGLVPAVVYRRPHERFWISLPFHEFVILLDTLRKKAGIQ